MSDELAKLRERLRMVEACANAGNLSLEQWSKRLADFLGNPGYYYPCEDCSFPMCYPDDNHVCPDCGHKQPICDDKADADHPEVSPHLRRG